jgi:hypothetical protein
VFDGEESSPQRLSSGVPQGSPLSPILFIIYLTTLYEELGTVARSSVIGFSDDTNILAFGATAEENCRTLEKAWKVCERWALRHGMQFEPNKSELMHFTRARSPSLCGVRLANTEKAPTTSTRFLGVWLDRKLTWKAHLKETQKKLETQRLALTRLAAKTWGFSLNRAREVYTKVIRAAIAHGSSAYHQCTEKGGKPHGIARELAKEQARCLRTVTGTYKATSVRQLETEAAIPPLDLYLSGRVARFEQRMERTGMNRLIQDSCAAVARKVRYRRGVRTRDLQEERKRKTEAWLNEAKAAQAERSRNNARTQNRTQRFEEREIVHETIAKEWKRRWEKGLEDANRRRGRAVVPADAPPNIKRLELHEKLRKEESSLLIQMRTEKIGLRAFLFERKVPEVMTPACECGNGYETALHVAAYCRKETSARRELPFAMHSERDYRTAMERPERAAILVRWFMRRRRTREFAIALQIADSDEIAIRAPN